MSDKYKGSERRRVGSDTIKILVDACEKRTEIMTSGLGDLTELCNAIDKKVDTQNGRVATNEKRIKSLFGKLRIVADDDLEERSVSKGKRMMMTIIGGIVATVLTILISATGLYFLAKRTIITTKADQMQQIEYKIDRVLAVYKSNDKEPAPEANIVERLKEILRNSP